MRQLFENVYVYEDTCHVYVLKNGEKAVLVDFGSGSVMDHMHEIGVRKVTDVLITHHHRDQLQGLAAPAAAGLNVWVPHTERDLIENADNHWQAREIYNNYNMRSDRFSSLASIPAAGTLKDYGEYEFCGYTMKVEPTPGHTIGSVSLLTKVDGKQIAFCGDLIYGPGKLQSLAATQWTYNGAEGVSYSMLSLLRLREIKLAYLLPSHGEVIDQPAKAIDLLLERLERLMAFRGQSRELLAKREKPYVPITRHLLRNRTCWANSYVVLSESGKALVIDYGYDFNAGLAAGADRASRRPWLYTLEKLKQQYGVHKIDVALPTHFHDDHVAGFNLLRDVEGTEVWAAENFADILEHPDDYDLPCIWYDAIPVDRQLPLAHKIAWEEYEFTLYEQSGHTLYAVAIDFEVDGKRVLAIGDQYQDTDTNYVYKNGFRVWDYRDSADLYERLRPDLLIAGHCEPLWTDAEMFAKLVSDGAELEAIHRDLLPEDVVEFRGDGSAAYIRPYQKEVAPGEEFTFTVDVKNPSVGVRTIKVTAVVPDGWCVVGETEKQGEVAPKERAAFAFTVTAPPEPVRRARLAADVTIGDVRYGQQAECLVTVKGERSG
ncbi:MAG TPA: MBL fold metallo-hydrolase [Bacillales bacterium]|nr:MBL fold metallo-hydrolase [Bacillales bacterium]